MAAGFLLRALLQWPVDRPQAALMREREEAVLQYLNLPREH